MGQTQGGSSGNLELLKQIEDLKDDVILLTVQGEKVPVSGHGPYNADITVPIPKGYRYMGIADVSSGTMNSTVCNRFVLSQQDDSVTVRIALWNLSENTISPSAAISVLLRKIYK